MEPCVRVVRKARTSAPVPEVYAAAEQLPEEVRPDVVAGEIREREVDLSAPLQIPKTPKYDLLAGFTTLSASRRQPVGHAPPRIVSETVSHAATESAPAKVTDCAPSFDVDETELRNKLAWTGAVDYSEADVFDRELGELRFDFEGELISPYCVDLAKGLRCAEEGEVYGLSNHGLMSHLPGYSVPELVTLLGSTAFDKQTVIALRVLANVLRGRFREHDVLYRLRFGPEVSVDAEEPLTGLRRFGYGFGLHRFNEYLTRSVLLHEKLLFVVFTSTNTQVMDMALVALAELLAPLSVELGCGVTLSYVDCLSVLLPRHANVTRDFLTARRSVLRREDLQNMLVGSTTSDMSEPLQLMVVQPPEEEDDGDELEYRKSDPLLSVLLWGKPGVSPEVLKAFASRLVGTLENEECCVACLRLLSGLCLHSRFGANIVGQFLKDHADTEGRSPLRVLLERMNLDPGSSLRLLTALLQFLDILHRTGNEGKLNQLFEPLRIDGQIWRIVGTALNDVDTCDLEQLLAALSLAHLATNDVDSDCGLLSFYESLIQLFVRLDVERPRHLALYIKLVEVAQMQPNESFVSLLLRYSPGYLKSLLAVSNPNILQLKAIEAAAYVMSVAFEMAAGDGDAEGRTVRARLIDMVGPLVASMSEVISQPLPQFAQAVEDAVKVANLTDYQIGLTGSVTGSERVWRKAKVLEALVALLRVATETTPLIQPVKEIGEHHAFVMTFPARKRYAINTSDVDCFCLANPLLEAWARYAIVSNQVTCQTLSCAFYDLTAMELKRFVRPRWTEGEWRVFLSLAEGRCYEVEAPVPSTMLSTNLARVLVTPHLSGLIAAAAQRVGSEELVKAGFAALELSVEVAEGFGSVWVYELLELLSCEASSALDLQRVELLHARVVGAMHCGDAEGELVIRPGVSGVVARLMAEWSETFVYNVKTRVLDSLGTRVQEGATGLTMVWLWLLSSSGLRSVVQSPWMSVPTLNACHRVITPELVERCGLPPAAFGRVAAISSFETVAHMVARWLAQLNDPRDSLVRTLAHNSLRGHNNHTPPRRSLPKF